MQIEAGAKDILKSLSRLKGDFDKFSENYRVLGGHLSHANKTYAESEKRLSKFGDKLELAGGTQDKLLE